MSDGASVEAGTPGAGIGQEGSSGVSVGNGVGNDSTGNGSPGNGNVQVEGGAASVHQVLEAAAAAEEKPERCESCGKREAHVLTTSPTHKSKAGLLIPIWLCAVCASLVPQPVVKPEVKPKKKRRRGRLSAGKNGTVAMTFAYRLGGLTARQLGQLFLLDDKGMFSKSRVPREAAAAKGAAEILARLRAEGLMKSVGIWRSHAVGERGGRIEEFYYLEGEGILWGAVGVGVVDAKGAQDAYKRHQLPRRAEHSAYRNDIFIRMLKDIGKSRRLYEGNPSEVVVSKVEDFIGESWEQYPYAVARFVNKRGAEEPRRGRTWEWLYPDGHPRFVWEDKLECAYDVEAERESWAPQGANKVDRYAAWWLRLYRQLEKASTPPVVAELQAELDEMNAYRERTAQEIKNPDLPRSEKNELVTHLTR